MQTKTKRDRTGELIDVPLDTTGRLANKLIGIRSEIFNLSREEKQVANDLAAALKGQNRLKISVQGFTVRVKETFASTTVLVKKEKNA